MTDSLILYELYKIRDASTNAKVKHIFNFRITRPVENFHFKEPILITRNFG